MTTEAESAGAKYHDHDRGASVRTIIQSLILAGIVGLVGMVVHQGQKQADADSDRRAQIATLQAQVLNVQATLVGLPDLGQRVTRMEANQAELMRRQGADDARWEQLGSAKLKGWTR